MPLKYLFIAEYKDSVYEQNAEDISISNDKTKSCFYDVKQDEVLRFHLVGGGCKYTTDLRDGHFEINGIPFRFHDEALKDFRLIFWRQHTHETGAKSSHRIVYLMGWQTNNGIGQNIKRIMYIS